MQSFHKLILLGTDRKLETGAFVVTGAFGTILHVLLDVPMYTDIQPFYPLKPANSMYKIVSSSEIYVGTMWTGVIGLLFYASLLLFQACSDFRKNST